MTNLYLASQILLWLALAGLAVLVAALARQIGLLHERIAPAGALSLHRHLRAGDTAPVLPLTALDGRRLVVGGPRGARSQLLFFLAPDCPVCKTLLPILRSVARAERHWLDLVLASDGPPEPHRRLVAAERLDPFPYVLSEKLGRAFAVAKLPYAVLIDPAGRIAALGLVNNREHLESLFEAKERGVGSIQDFVLQRQPDGA